MMLPRLLICWALSRDAENAPIMPGFKKKKKLLGLLRVKTQEGEDCCSLPVRTDLCRVSAVRELLQGWDVLVNPDSWEPRAGCWGFLSSPCANLRRGIAKKCRTTPACPGAPLAVTGNHGLLHMLRIQEWGKKKIVLFVKGKQTIYSPSNCVVYPLPGRAPSATATRIPAVQAQREGLIKTSTC